MRHLNFVVQREILNVAAVTFFFFFFFFFKFLFNGVSNTGPVPGPEFGKEVAGRRCIADLHVLATKASSLSTIEDMEVVSSLKFSDD